MSLHFDHAFVDITVRQHEAATARFLRVPNATAVRCERSRARMWPRLRATLTAHREAAQLRKIMAAADPRVRAEIAAIAVHHA
jgi:hypothetical protein